MEITVKVFPTLKKYLSPRWAELTEFQVSLDQLPGAPKTVAGLIAHLGLPDRQVGQIILNGRIKWDKTTVLCDGDRVVLSIFVGGG